jgi:hypothetical protein
VDVGFVKLTSGSFCGNMVFKMNIQFSCHVFCAAVVLDLSSFKIGQSPIFQFFHTGFDSTVTNALHEHYRV